MKEHRFDRKMSRFFSLFAALLLVLTLIPVQAARADEHVCPECGQPMSIVKLDSYQHGYLCVNPNCPDIDHWHGSEDHSLDEECFCSVCEVYCHIEETWYPDGIHIPATCTEWGYEWDSDCIYCSRCKQYRNGSGGDVETIPPRGHDWVINTEEGDNGWFWAADGSSATVYLQCQRENCDKSATATDAAPQAGTKTYDENTGKVSCTYTATVTKDEKTFTDTLTVETDPIERRTDLWVVGDQTYTSMPQSVPESYDCHYQMDWWTGPVLTSDSGVYEQNGEFYRDVTYTDTMVYKLAGYYIQKVNATPATCTEKGVKEHYQCWMCKRRYMEKTAENEVTLEQLQSDALGHDWVIDTTQGDNGWEWAADGSSATVYLQCQRDGCGEPATATDAAPQAGDVSYNPATGKAEVSYAASVTKDGQTFTAETILSREITAYYYTVSFFDGEGSPIGDAYVLLDNSGSDDPVAYLIDRYARPGSETINCHYGFSGWGDPIFQGYEVSMSQQKIHVFEKYSTTAQYLDALLTHVGEVPASCTQYGTEEYWTCETCGRKYSDDKGINEIDTPAVIGKLGHDLVSHVAQAPTCTAVGWDAYDTCTRCEYTTYVEKAALGHTEVIDPAVAATCTEAGLTEGKHCSVCNMVLLEQKTVEALGHDWGEWQVTKSPQIGTAGERERTCSRCGETETEPVAALIGYSMTGAADGSWTKGSTKGFTITVKRSEDDENCFSHYQETLMDGTPADVSAEAGSTVVTFSAATLEKLTTGTHTVTIRFDDGEVVGKLVINEAESQTTPQPTQPAAPKPTQAAASQVPKTGDNSNTGLWVALLIGSLLAMLMAICAGRITREKNN